MKNQKNSKNNKANFYDFIKNFLPRNPVFVFLVVLFVVIVCIVNPYFFTISNFMTILRQSCILFVLSLGLTAVVISGNIDLSVGQTAALTGCICAKIIVSGYGIIPAILCALFIGLMIGIFNGILVCWIRLPSFVSTYGMSMVLSGIALLVMRGGIIYELPPGFTWLSIGYLGKIPVIVITTTILFLGFLFLMNKTTFGRKVYLYGKNSVSAYYSGINGKRVILSCYALCGVTAAWGGVLMTARLNAADAAMGDAYGLLIVAAVVAGGTALSGGKGGVGNTLAGALFLTMILNFMNMSGVDSNWQNFTMGVLILLSSWIGSKKDAVMVFRKRGTQ